MFVDKLKIKINCSVAHVKNELMKITKKITNFKVIYFNSVKLFL